MALTDAASGVISGLLTKGGVSAPNLSALFAEIDSAGANQRQLINALPAEIQKQYEEYKAANVAAGTALQTGTKAVGGKLRSETAALYGSDAPAVQAAIDAMKTQTFADLPGQQAAIREALAATGGFDRGTASKQLAAPVIQAAGQVGQGIQNITSQQLQQKQQAEQSAINTITSTDNNVLQQLFGMSKEQALTIMNSNRQDLKDQMTDLVNQSAQQTNQKLGVLGAQANNEYQQRVGEKAQKDAFTNSLVNLGVEGVSAAAGSPGIQGFMRGLGSSEVSGHAPTSAPIYSSTNQR